MCPSPSSFRCSFFLFLLFSFGLLPAQVFGQQSPLQVAVQPRITRPVDDAELTTLRGNVHPMAVPKFDRGTAPSTMPLERMLLVLKRSPEQDSFPLL